MNLGENINRDISDVMLVKYAELSNKRINNVKHYISSKVDRIVKDYLWNNISNNIASEIELIIIRK
jgi:hypothetical protein